MAEKGTITRKTSPGAIEEDIARTRQEMGETVSAIQERLSPAHLKEKAKGRIRERIRHTSSRFNQTAKETGPVLADIIKKNPVPIALISIGAAWLISGRPPGGSLPAEPGGEKGRTISERAKVGGRLRRERAFKAKGGLQRMAQDNPLGTTLTAFFMGALAGFSIPESAKEKELIGPAGGGVERKEVAAQMTNQKAQHAAEEAKAA